MVVFKAVREQHIDVGLIPQARIANWFLTSATFTCVLSMAQSISGEHKLDPNDVFIRALVGRASLPCTFEAGLIDGSARRLFMRESLGQICT